MLKIDALTKRYKKRYLFKNVSFELPETGCFVVTGANGTGKSTFLKCLAGLVASTSGCVVFQDKTISDSTNYFQSLGFVAPYASLFEELSAFENIQLFSKTSGKEVSFDQATKLLREYNLDKKGQQKVGEFSSGMKQRLKYLISILKRPAVLILDEPTANLDRQGKKFVADLVDGLKTTCLVIIATNEVDEYSWGETVLELV